MRLSRYLSALLLFFLSVVILDAKVRPEHVLVIANSSDPDSLELAHYYANKRAIPERNIIALPMPEREVVTWQEYLDTIYNPLLKILVEEEWIQADKSSKTDRIGRYHYVIYGHEIDFAVLCRGVPLKISEDATRMPPSRPSSIKAEFWSNRAAVDSELAMLPFPESAVVAYMPNPLFNNLTPGAFTLQQVMRVARLDGPTHEDALGLVDLALEGERTGLLGRSYVDYSQKYEEGDEWLRVNQRLLDKMGFGVNVDAVPELMPWYARFDAPVLYFGWWAWDPDGLIAAPDFRFPPGAIAIHIHSFSANTLRSTSKFWVGPLVSRGVTATVGNVYEPYLQLTHYPHLFLGGIRSGMQAGEAAYYSLPILSWHNIFVGDPLYAPMTVTLEEQLAAIDRGELSPYAQYAVIRRMNQLRYEEKLDEACELGHRYMVYTPGLALAYRLARLELERKRPQEALEVLGIIRGIPFFPTEEQGLAYEVARFLFDNGARKSAFVLYQKLINASQMPAEIARQVLPDGVACAAAVGELEQLEQWRVRMRELASQSATHQ